MNNSRGFTLIELVVVIVILGILAAVALPKFVDLSSEARTASAAGIAGAISSAASINYGARIATVGATTRKGVAYSAADPCGTTALNTILQSAVPSGYNTAKVTATDTCASVADGTTVACSVTPASGGTASTATVICVQ
ncbi:MAG: type II secretion system protein [Rhodocyclaceae bacterium]